MSKLVSGAGVYPGFRIWKAVWGKKRQPKKERGSAALNGWPGTFMKMPEHRNPRGIAGGARCRGFSLLELLVVLAIAMVVMAISVPTMIKVIDTSRLRGSLSEVSNLAQACRTQAVKTNAAERLHFTTSGGKVVLFVTPSTSTATAPLPGDPRQLTLSNKFSIAAAPSGAGAPPQLTGMTMWGSSLNPQAGVDPYFNSRGLPCYPAAGVCSATPGFVYYFKYSASSGTRWAAVGISPAGRIKTWLWDGTVW